MTQQDVVDAALHLIAALNPALNAFVTVLQLASFGLGPMLASRLVGEGYDLILWTSQMLFGAPRTLDVRRLGFERLLRGEPLHEFNVIG